MLRGEELHPNFRRNVKPPTRQEALEIARRDAELRDQQQQ